MFELQWQTCPANDFILAMDFHKFWKIIFIFKYFIFFKYILNTEGSLCLPYIDKIQD